MFLCELFLKGLFYNLKLRAYCLPDQFNKERKISVYLKKLKALGWEGSCSCRVSLPAEAIKNCKTFIGIVCAFWAIRKVVFQSNSFSFKFLNSMTSFTFFRFRKQEI